MSRYLVMVSWGDVPHLDEEAKKALLGSIPPYQRDARTKGIPQLGSGAVYPLSDTDISEDPFEIPTSWPRVYALDVGWNRTAAVWGALDRENDRVHLYAEHYFAHSEPGENARAIKGRGEWIPGVIDPASRGRSQIDGGQLIEKYQALGLDIAPAINAVESGIYDVWERMVSGRLKVFKSLASFWAEFRLYRRDEKGKIVKKNDHLMDSTRYLIASGLSIAKVKPVAKPRMAHLVSARDLSSGWMG